VVHIFESCSLIIPVGEFKKAYPEAKVIGVEGLAEKKKQEGLELDGGFYFFSYKLVVLILS
jgi:hypothetical protein